MINTVEWEEFIRCRVAPSVDVRIFTSDDLDVKEVENLIKMLEVTKLNMMSSNNDIGEQ